MSLQKQLDEITAGVKTKAPAEILDVMSAATASLAESNLVANALKVGEKVPSFTLPNASGVQVNIHDLLKLGPVVIAFYRGAWCPYCSLELKALQDALPEIKNLGANLVAVSPEKPEFATEVIEKHGVAFEVLTDEGNSVAKQFGIVFTLGGELRKVYSETFGLDLEKFNGDSSWQLPVPATFVVDKEGIVKYAFVNVDYRQRAEPKEILQALQGL